MDRLGEPKIRPASGASALLLASSDCEPLISEDGLDRTGAVNLFQQLHLKRPCANVRRWNPQSSS
jgi:hypothetical protein